MKDKQDIDNASIATIKAALENKNKIQVRVGHYNVRAMVDSGASVSVLNHNLLKKAFNKNEFPQIYKSDLLMVKGVCSTPHRIRGKIDLEIDVNGLQMLHSFHILEDVHYPLILGEDFLRTHKAKIDFSEQVVTFHDELTVATLHVYSPKPRKDYNGVAKIQKAITVQPYTECNIPLAVSKVSNNSTVLLEPVHFLNKYGIIGSRTLNQVQNHHVVYRIINPTHESITLKPQSVLAHVFTMQHEPIFSLDDNESTQTPNISLQNDDSTTDIQTSLQKAAELDINIDEQNLTAKEIQELKILIGNNRTVFAKNSSELGKTTLHYHAIHTTTDKPVKSPRYAQSPKMRVETDKQIDEMIENDVIEESMSNYQSPVVLVKKANGQYRFAIDFRKLNAVTEMASYPIPKLEEVFDTIADAKPNIFSVLDLASGFHQVPLDEKTKHKTAFITHRGLYQFKRLCFGLTNAPATFQMLMTKVLKELNWKIALIYIDDILVFSNGFQNHKKHLQLVFDKLKQANLTLQPAKCHFAAQQVKYLGHVISANGIQVDTKKTSAVSEYPTPKTIKQLRSFLGMCAYYKRFIKDYSRICEPLNMLLRKNVTFSWQTQHDKAFSELKQKLTSAPILTFPDFSKPYILAVDASDMSIGFVLSQINSKNQEKVIAYGGRALQKREQAWHINHKEGLALVEAIKTFKAYLTGSKFTVYTDNITVRWLENNRDAQGRLGRWALFLQQYKYDIMHRPGRQNQVADGLSRREYPVDEPQQNDDDLPVIGFLQPEGQRLEYNFEYAFERKIPEIVAIEVNKDDYTDDVTLPNRERLWKLQSECEDYKDMIKYKKNGTLPEDTDHARKITIEGQQYEIDNDILIYLYHNRNRGLPPGQRLVKQLCIPRKFRRDILYAYHDCIAGGGHQGTERTVEALRTKYFWPNMWTDVHNYIKTCETCQQSKDSKHQKPVPLHPLPIEDVFARWHMDFLELPATPDKYRYVLLMVDSYSKWCEAFPLKTMEATEVARILVNEIFSRYGACRTLVSDRAQNFMSKLVEAVSALFDVSRHYTSSYHAETNATCERFNSVIAQMLRAYCKTDQSNWPEYIPFVMMSHRATPCTQSTQYSPFYLLYGQQMRLPIDIAFIPKPGMAKEPKLHLMRVLEHLQMSRKAAAENARQKQIKYKTQHDKKAEPTTLTTGDRVWLYCSRVPTGKSPKLLRKWTGPYQILQSGPNDTFKLRHEVNHKTLKSLVHAKRLKEYHSPETRPAYLLPEYEGIELNPEELDEDDTDIGTQRQTDTNDEEEPPPRKQTQKQHQQNTQGHNFQQSQGITQHNDVQVNHQKEQHSNADTQVKQHANKTYQAANLDSPDNKSEANNTRKQPEKPKKKKQTKQSQEKLPPFKEEEIEKILEYSLYQNKPIYKIKFTGQPKTSWQDGFRISQTLKQNFHKLYTAKGKKRKRPDNKKKFFEPKPINTINSIETSTPSTYISDVHLDRNQRESRYWVKRPNGQPVQGSKTSGELSSEMFEKFIKILKQKENECIASNNPLKNTHYVPVSGYHITTDYFIHHFTPKHMVPLRTPQASAQGIHLLRLKLIEHYERANGPAPHLHK